MLSGMKLLLRKSRKVMGGMPMRILGLMTGLSVPDGRQEGA